MSAFPFFNFFVLLFLVAPLLVADTVTLSGGEHKSGRILGMEGDALLLSAQPIPGLPPVVLRFHKSRLIALDFAEDPILEELLSGAGRERLTDLDSLWDRFAPLLAIPGSPTARIGLRRGLLLLDAYKETGGPSPLAIFEKIAAAAPVMAEQEAAKQGVLRSLIAEQKWEQAESEAELICKSACGLPLLGEARLTAGLVQAARLRAFVKENPRWIHDEFARPERDRLHTSSLDELLGAALLPGVPREVAARGLRAAIDVYVLAGDTERAATLARDLKSFHAGSAEAATALEWLGSQSEQTHSKPH